MDYTTAVALYKNWKVSTVILEESSVAILTHDDVQIAYADNVYDVLNSCPENIATSLRSQLIQNEIDKSGGLVKYKEQVYRNQLKYGVNCYNYLDVDTLRAFAQVGIYLSNKV